MSNHYDLISMVVFLVVFFGTSGLGLVFYWRWYGDSQRAINRLKNLSDIDQTPLPEKAKASLALSAIPKVGQLLMPSEEQRLTDLRTQLIHAGLYSANALRVFLGVKLLLQVSLPVIFGLIPFLLGVLPPRYALLVFLVCICLGQNLPGQWLRARTKKRQSLIRAGIPDTLDMLVLCLEGGVSLMAGIRRVTQELYWVHPGLALEMNIVQREIQLGLSPGEALKKFGERCDLKEIRELASVILQSERFGAGMVKALRMHADCCRQDRQQQVEEKAQKAAVKILFPTLLCIFPAIFIVLLGPAAFKIASLFAD